jgi:hypothetical protein
MTVMEMEIRWRYCRILIQNLEYPPAPLHTLLATLVPVLPDVEMP